MNIGTFPDALRRRSLGWSRANRLKRLRETNARVHICCADGSPIELSDEPPLATVHLRSVEHERALWRGDALRLAEAFVEGTIVVEGELREVVRAADSMSTVLSPWQKAKTLARIRLRRRSGTQRLATSHYDRPFDFFRSWLGPTRSYTHALFADHNQGLDQAQERKFERALEALSIAGSDRILDIGCGWGSFLEYAGRKGFRVDGITVSKEQARFVRGIIERRSLPCRIFEMDFFDFEAEEPYAGAVLMGSLEHLMDTRRVANRLRHLMSARGRIWADFCAQSHDPFPGEFITREVWPGAAMYVHLPTLIEDFNRADLRMLEVVDDTAHYARTVEIWGDRLDNVMGDLGLEFGTDVRVFQLLLRGSQHFLETRQTLAYHVVAASSE